MKTRLYRLLPLALLSAFAVAEPASAPAPAASPAMATLTPFSAGYEVRLNNLPFKARARQTLSALGNERWRLELRIESFLLDTREFSEFRWDGEKCHTIPEHYGYSRQGIGRNQSLDMRFDFAKKTLVRRDAKSTSSFAIADNTEDKLGHTLALACRVARGARGPVGVDVAWDHDVRHFEYQVSAAEEAVGTPLGTFRALRVQRLRADSDRITTSWLAPAANWQSVQMQHSEGDGRLFQLRLLELDNATAR